MFGSVIGLEPAYCELRHLEERQQFGDGSFIAKGLTRS